jgi:hypothetical protein
MHGEIGAESYGVEQPGSGSTFWFTAHFGRSSAASAELPGFANKTALYVGAEGIQHQSILAQLAQWQIEVSSIDNCGDALTTIQSSPAYDVVIIDSGLPDTEVRSLAISPQRNIGGGDTAEVDCGVSGFEEQCYLLETSTSCAAFCEVVVRLQSPWGGARGFCERTGSHALNSEAAFSFAVGGGQYNQSANSGQDSRATGLRH